MRKLNLLFLALLLWSDPAFAATRTVSVAGGNWGTAATWAEVAVPTAADDVVTTGTSGALTIDGTSGSPSLARSVNFTGYTSTLTWGAAKELDVGDGSGGSFVLVSGMTLVPSSTSVLVLKSTTTGNTVTFAGKNLGLVTINGSGGAWTFTDNPSSTRTWTFTAGSVTTAAAGFSLQAFNLNGGTLTLGGPATMTATSTVAGGTLAGSGRVMTATTFTASSGSYTIGTHTGSGSLTVSGATVAIGSGGATGTSMTYSAGSTTASGTLSTSSGSISVSGTGSLDATGQAVNPFSSLSMSSTGTFKAATITAGTTCSHSAGTWQTTGNVACTTFTDSGSTLRSLSMGTGATWTLSGTGTVWSFGSAPTNLTFTPGTSLIKSTDTSATTKSMTGGGQTFNNFQVSGAAGAATFTFNTVGATFNTLTFDPDSNIKLFSGATFTASTLSAAGTSGHTIALASTTGASAATLSVPAAGVTMDYNVMQDIAVGPDAVYAGANSTSTSGNTGWIFAAKPTSGQHFVASM